MGKKDIWEYLSNALPKIVLALFVFIVYFAFAFGNYEHTKVNRDLNIRTSDAAYIGEEGESALPCRVEFKKDKTYTFTDTIPEDIKSGDAMMLLSLYSETKVYVDDKLIGGYGSVRPLAVGRLVGNIRILVPLDESMAGKKATIEVTPFYSVASDYHEPLYGEISALWRKVMGENALRLVIVSMMLSLFLIAFALFVYQSVKRSNLNGKTLWYFDLFVLLVGTWIICSSDMPQFFTDANEGISIVSFLCLTMMGVAYMGFCENVMDNGADTFMKIKVAGWFIPILNIVCFFFGICDPMTLLPISHIYFVIVAGTSLAYAIKGYRKNPNNKLMCIAICELIVFAGMGLIFYFVSPSKGYDAIAFGMGMLIFFFMLMGIIVRKIVKMVEKEKEISSYESLAYGDALTGLENRSSFEKFFENIEENGIIGKTVTLFMFDLNYLKLTNDKFGHKAGDELLAGLAFCIHQTFDKVGSSYRLGGDEFAAIVVGHADQTLNMVEALKKNIEAYNKHHEHKVSTAVGYATAKYKAGDVDFYDKLFREADDVMYANKVRCHKEEGMEVRNTKDI